MGPTSHCVSHQVRAPLSIDGLQSDTNCGIVLMSGNHDEQRLLPITNPGDYAAGNGWAHDRRRPAWCGPARGILMVATPALCFSRTLNQYSALRINATRSGRSGIRFNRPISYQRGLLVSLSPVLPIPGEPESIYYTRELGSNVNRQYPVAPDTRAASTWVGLRDLTVQKWKNAHRTLRTTGRIARRTQDNS